MTDFFSQQFRGVAVFEIHFTLHVGSFTRPECLRRNVGRSTKKLREAKTNNGRILDCCGVIAECWDFELLETSGASARNLECRAGNAVSITSKSTSIPNQIRSKR